MFKRVLILSASAGAGHLRAAEAIEKAFIQLGAAQELRNIDTLEYTSKLFHNLYSKAYIELAGRVPEGYGWLYDHFDRPWHNDRLRRAFERLNTRPFVKMLEEYQPDMTVCTYYLPAQIISWLKEKNRLNTRQAIVVTDFDIHAMWLCGQYEHYFVALEETKAHLQELGVPDDKVTVSGIPIDPVFGESKERTAVRLQYGLDPALPAILISAGGFGMGPIEELMQSLIKMHNRVQVIAVCGRNQELLGRLDKFNRALPASCPVRFTVLGYTTEMDVYMSAADLVVGKPGGLTASEALAKGLAFVIINPIQGQEERNADHLLEEGIAIRCNNLPVLAYKLDRLLDDPMRLAAMQANARRLGKPHAACDIVKKLMSLREHVGSRGNTPGNQS
jgi:processive 1,2-diacylglycerol beta-glucosyltransferase